jgi:hypothetical protein
MKKILVDLFALHSLCGVGIMRAICAVRKEVDVVLLSVLLRMLHWLVGFFFHASTTSYVVPRIEPRRPVRSPSLYR